MGGSTIAPANRLATPNKPPSLASLMRARGAQAVYLHNGDLDWGEERWLLQQDGYTDAEGFADLGCPRLTSWGTEDRCLIDRLIRWIDERRGQPFVAVCWTDQTHDPYRLGLGVRLVDFFHGKPPANLPDDSSRYLNVLHETDHQLARLFAALRERGIADDMVVAVTGDHGESFSTRTSNACTGSRFTRRKSRGKRSRCSLRPI